MLRLILRSDVCTTLNTPCVVSRSLWYLLGRERLTKRRSCTHKAIWTVLTAYLVHRYPHLRCELVESVVTPKFSISALHNFNTSHPNEEIEKRSFFSTFVPSLVDNPSNITWTRKQSDSNARTCAIASPIITCNLPHPSTNQSNKTIQIPSLFLVVWNGARPNCFLALHITSLVNSNLILAYL